LGFPIQQIIKDGYFKMSIVITLPSHFYLHELSSPDKIINNENFDFNNINDNFVISRDKKGNIVSIFKDNIWNFHPYRTTVKQDYKILFEKHIPMSYIHEAKKIMFLIATLKTGRNNSSLAVGTLIIYFRNLVVNLANYANNHKISIHDILTNYNLMLMYIKKVCKSKNTASTFSELILILHRNSNQITKVFFQFNEITVQSILQEILYNKKRYTKKTIQVSVIPSRIFSESIRQRWIHIKIAEQNINSIVDYFKHYIRNNKYGTKTKRYKMTKYWHEIIELHNLKNLFDYYHITDINSFRGYIAQLQSTCKHLIHIYTGMRDDEVLSLSCSCFQRVEIDSGICRIIGNTSKLEGSSKQVKWVTSKEIKRVIDLLKNINSVIADYYNVNIDGLPLFIGTNILYGNKNKSIKVSSRKNSNELALEQSTLRLTKHDIEEIEEIEFYPQHNLSIGDTWNFKTHQYRRSLVVYSILSGLVSLGSLQIQLKHLFLEMTEYYAKGTSYARQLFDTEQIIDKDIVNDFHNEQIELEALAYIKEIIFSDEKLFGDYGSYIENHRNTTLTKKDYIIKNRKETIQKIKNGHIAYKNTALGGCTSTLSCNDILVGNITKCFTCTEAIIKNSKLDNVILIQKSYMNQIDKKSVEYKTEEAIYCELIKQKNKKD
jgi:integrase